MDKMVDEFTRTITVNEVADAVYGAWVVAAVNVALAMAAVYDHVITIQEEYEFVWKRPRVTIVPILFLINRYLGEASLLYSAVSTVINSTSQQCVDPSAALAWMGPMTLWAMQGIMVFRVSAMFSHSRKIIYFLLVAFTAEITVNIIIQLTFIDRVWEPSLKTVIVESTTQTFCLPGRRRPPTDYRMDAKNWDWFWFPIVVFELLVLGLSLYKGMRYCGLKEYWERSWIREKLRFGKGSKGSNGELGSGDAFSASKYDTKPSLVWVVLRDSISFPILAVAVCTINFIGFVNFPDSITQILLALSIFIARILGCRLVLNLREAYYAPFEEEYYYDERERMGGIRFASVDVGTNTGVTGAAGTVGGVVTGFGFSEVEAGDGRSGPTTTLADKSQVGHGRVDLEMG